MKKGNFKPRKNREFLKTKKKEVVDYFPRGGTKEDFTFNTTTLDKAAMRETMDKKFLNKKRKVENKLANPQIDDDGLNPLNSNANQIEIESDIVDKTTSRALLPRFKVGDLVLLTVSEIRKDYMIANYSRNKKAMIHKTYSGFQNIEGNFSFKNHFKLGQFICGAVVSAGNDIQLSSGLMNKKILVSIDPKIVNTGLNESTLVVGMDLYGKLIKEEGRFGVDFSFTDDEEDLMKFNETLNKKIKNQFDEDSVDEIEEDVEEAVEEDEDDEEDNFEENLEDLDISKFSKKKKSAKIATLNNLDIKLIDNEESPDIFSGKLIDSYYFFKLTKIENINNRTLITVSLDYSKYKFPIKKCDFKSLRPGFFFKSNMTRELTNGIEVAFGGNIGTIFNDHMKVVSSSTESKYKNMVTRIIHVSVDKSRVSLSARKHIVSLNVEDAEKKKSFVGTIQTNAKVHRVLFGNSYSVEINYNNTSINAFLHRSQVDNEKIYTPLEEIEKVLIKEYNFFDDRAMLTARKGLIDNEFHTLENIYIGKITKGVIEEIKPDCLIIRLNNYIQGKLPKEHITDFPLTKIPKKFKLGQQLQVRIFAFDNSTKYLQFTTKESLMDEKVLLTGNPQSLNEGEDIQVVYIGNSLFQHSGNIIGKLLNFNKINLKETFKIGKIYQFRIFKVKYNEKLKTCKLFLTNETEVWQPGVGDYENLMRRNPILSTINTVLNNSENNLEDNFITSGNVYDFQILSSKRLLKLLLKNGVEATVLQENVETFTRKFLIAKLIKENVNVYAFIPRELISDFYTEKMIQIYSKLKSEEITPVKMLVLYHNVDTKTIFVTPKKSLVEKYDKIASFDHIVNDNLYYGFINKKVKSGIVVQFLDNDKSVIKTGENPNNHLNEGQTVIAKYKQDLTNKNLKKRFDMNLNNRTLSELKEEAIENIQNYLHDLNFILTTDKNNLVNNTIKVNSTVEGKIGIVKEYGVLISLKSDKSNVTGFLKNEHMNEENSNYQIGLSKKFRVIDIDFTDNIVYLTDKIESNLKTEFNSEDYVNKENILNFTIELFHDNYISACLQSNPNIKALIACNLLNFNLESSNISDFYKIGDTVSSKVIDYIPLLNKLIVEPPIKLLNKIQTSTKSSQGKSKGSITPGSIVKGRINGIKGNYVFVYIDKTTLGKIPVSEFQGDLDQVKENLKNEHLRQDSLNDSSLLTNLPEALKIQCKILHVEVKNNFKICDLISINETHDRINTLSKLLDKYGEIENIGIISKIDIYNKFPIKIDHGSQDKKAQIHYSHIPVEKILNLKSEYKIGEKINFYAKENEESGLIFSLIPFSKIPAKIAIQVENTYPVRILKSIPGRGLVVDLSIYNNHTEAFVDICEISDDLHPNPLNLHKTGTLTLARVLKFDEKLNKYFLSLRNSITDNEHYEIIKNGSTLKYKKHFESFERIGDYRNKIMKFGMKQVIEQNLVAIGYVTSSSEKGVFIKLANDVIVRASMRELTDEKTTKPYLLFKQDSLVILRIISIYKNKDANDDKMNINVSLRESVVKFNLTLKTKDLSINNFYLCNVMNGNEDKFEVTILGSTFTGLIKKKHIRKFEIINNKMDKKESILLQLVKLDKNVHPPKLRFSSLNSEDVDESIIINSISKEDLEKNKINENLYNNVKDIVEQYKQDEVSLELKELEKNVDKIDYESLLKRKEEENSDNENEVEDLNDNEDEELELEDNIDEDDSDEDVLYEHDVKAQFLKGIGFSKNKEDMEVDEENIEVDDQMDVEDQQNVETPHKSSKRREKDHLKQELKTREKEENTQLQSTEESVESHEKKILSDPNNSINWIQYAAYILDKLGLAPARKIFERAITTINISLSKEKLNVWIAYMNLENSYGSQITFKSAVERALEVNDKKTIYKHLVSIYKFSKKYDLAFEVYKILTKNFFSDFTVWKNYLEFLFEIEEIKKTLTDPALINKYDKIFIEPKEGLNRALQVLGKGKHVDMLIYYGGLLYRFNFIEEARNTFESVLRNFPKRSDIWIVYIDKEIKHTKNLEKIRNVLEKALTVEFKIKILKTFIKKYLEFEKEFGTPKSMENVKILTQKLILEKMSNLQGEEDENEGNQNEDVDMN